MSISARVNLIITAERDEDIDELLKDIRDHRTDVPNPFPMYIQMVEVSREWQEGEPRGTLHGPDYPPEMVRPPDDVPAACTSCGLHFGHTWKCPEWT